MSVKVMGWVWDQDIPRDEKFVLLAYADHAEHDGSRVFPAIQKVAKKTGYSERSVQRITRKLEESGWLIPEYGQEGGRGISAHWRIPIEKGDILSQTEKGDKRDDKRVPFETERVPNDALKGDIAVSPEPSLTINKPPLREPPPSSGGVYEHYEANIGILTPKLSELIGGAIDDYPDAWIIEAIDIAVVNGARKWAYVSAILDRWKSNGKDGKRVAQKKDYTGGKFSEWIEH
jgi:DnaD/phage-associated family protein